MFDLSFNNIIHSNLINFSVMVAIIVWLCLKLNIAEKLEVLRKNIENKITSSEKDKEKAAEFLYNTEKSVENLRDEVIEARDKRDALRKEANEMMAEAKKKSQKFVKSLMLNIQ